MRTNLMLPLQSYELQQQAQNQYHQQQLLQLQNQHLQNQLAAQQHTEASTNNIFGAVINPFRQMGKSFINVSNFGAVISFHTNWEIFHQRQLFRRRHQSFHTNGKFFHRRE